MKTFMKALGCAAGATTTAWDMLTNVCNSVGCRFKVYSGKVEMGK